VVNDGNDEQKFQYSMHQFAFHFFSTEFEFDLMHLNLIELEFYSI